MPQSGTELHKEFNPENPPLGSTVVATFVWLGSSNIIDSVTDFLWTLQRVGNTYNLVEYVTANGISMATYVATNVQNYPYPKSVPGEELVVEAHLATSVPGGGTLVSAYSGVNPVFAQAVGGHSSASGSGSTTPTIADPGAITVSAGALAYAISMTSEGSAGRGPPAGFTYITNEQSVSPPFQFDAEYAVSSSAGSVDPAWQWVFTSPNTWLATVLALNPATGSSNQPPVAAFTASCSALTCSFTSTSSDPDGSISAYSWAFGDGATATAQNPGHTYAAAGTYPVTLTVTDNQGATGTTSQTVTVAAANQPPVANFVFNCTGLTCGFTSTSSDPDGTIAGYQWTFGDAAASTAQNPSHTYAAGGAYTVTLTVTDNRGATNTISKTATISPPPGATHLVFTVQPSATTAGGTISPPVQVAAQDGAGNTDASFSGSITVALTTNPSGGALSGTKTVTATNGVATFSTLSIDKAGNGYTLGATTSTGLTGATSAAFNVNAPLPAGVALDKWNGSLNETGRMLIKGFNPTNPHHGDAIVVTFFWLGSATIDSVTDVLTTSPYTPVGNQYNLIEYVTAGGISMATYVATNVLNFPDPNPDQSTVLAVRASL
ncbi:MAG TPA: PKD domain-containing protein, partial [Mycobacterium sp.]|nr:PKD domain-containing protein [Mycobacterium sp.]